MAANPDRPSRGRRRAAARRGGASPARRTVPEQTSRTDPRWEELLAPSEALADDHVAVADAAPQVAPGDADPTHRQTDEQPVVVVATTPGAPAARVTSPLAVAPRPPAPRSASAATSRTATSRTAAGRAATGPTAAPRAATPPPAAPAPGAGAPDPSSEFGRMFSRLLVRMGAVERRLEVFEGRARTAASSGEGAAPVPTPDTKAKEAEREYDRQMLTWLADRVEVMTAQIEEQRRLADGRTGVVDGVVDRAATLSVEFARLQAQIDDLVAASGEQDGAAACPQHQLLAPTVDELRQAATAADHRALAFEARLAQVETLPSVMEHVATNQFHRLAAELPSAPVDIEGVYKELDSVAEVVAARDAAVARGLDQIGSLDATVSQLHGDFVRIVEALAASQAAEEEVQERLRALDRRLEVLESPEHQVERLYSALDAVRGGAPEAPPPAAPETTDIRVADGAGSAQPGTASASQAPMAPPQQVIQSLAADLDRIRRSLEMLADEAPP